MKEDEVVKSKFSRSKDDEIEHPPVVVEYPKDYPPGLYTPHPANFTRAPQSARKKVCLLKNSTTFRAIVSAYKQAAYQILYEDDVAECQYIWFFNNAYAAWEESNHSSQ